MEREELLEYYKNFPAILREKLKSGEIKLPNSIQFNYEPLLAYRVIKRKELDESPITICDMKSYYEEGKKPRGKIVDETDPRLYSVSLFQNIRSVKNLWKFPNPNKKIAKGFVYMEGGPQETEDENHINWWLYENVIFNDFTIIKEDFNE